MGEIYGAHVKKEQKDTNSISINVIGSDKVSLEFVISSRKKKKIKCEAQHLYFYYH